MENQKWNEYNKAKLIDELNERSSQLFLELYQGNFRVIEKSRMIGPVGLHQFRCEDCGEIFDKGWTDEEALAELKQNFKGWPADECDLVCDDCYDNYKELKNDR